MIQDQAIKKDEPYSILIHPGKSSQWMASLMIRKLYETIGLPTEWTHRVVDTAKGKKYEGFTNVVNTKKVLIFDDCSYSGNQLKEIAYNLTYQFDDITVIVILPFITKNAYENIRHYNGRRLKLYNKHAFPSLDCSIILDDERDEAFDAFGSSNWDRKSLLFPEWKLPDDLSISNYCYSAIRDTVYQGENTVTPYKVKIEDASYKTYRKALPEPEKPVWETSPRLPLGVFSPSGQPMDIDTLRQYGFMLNDLSKYQQGDFIISDYYPDHKFEIKDKTYDRLFIRAYAGSSSLTLYQSMFSDHGSTHSEDRAYRLNWLPNFEKHYVGYRANLTRVGNNVNIKVSAADGYPISKNELKYLM
jgi:hypothetical protein